MGQLGHPPRLELPPPPPEEAQVTALASPTDGTASDEQ
jgi:hypothetical protein